MEQSFEKSIAVAGHLVFDEITFPDGNSTTAFGGISYNLAALVAKVSVGKVYALCEIGADRRIEFDRAFGGCHVLDTSLIKSTGKPNVVNRLVYDNAGRRREWNSRVPEPLSLERIPGSADGVLINFISGDDFRLEELERFRRQYRGLIYMDYHSLSLGRSPDGGRYYRRHPLWSEHIAACDILQMNMAELESIFEQKIGIESIPSACDSLHDSGPGTIIITMGERGAILSLNSGSKSYLIQGLSPPVIVDPTGCGDTLAAVAFHAYIVGDDILDAVVEGSRWAAAKAAFSGIHGFSDIDRFLARVPKPPDPVLFRVA